MKSKKIAAKVVRKLPGSSNYLQFRGLRETIRLQNDELIGLRQSVKRLEDRNDEWATEVATMRGDGKPLQVLWPVRPTDLIEADFRRPPKSPLAKRHQPPFTINWVIPPVGSVSGGHAVIFRLVQYLESQGHRCRLYVYDPMQVASLIEVKKNIKNHVDMQAEIFYNHWDVEPADALFATGWTTAYPVFNYVGPTKKFYLLQDYESMFEVSGSYSALTDNTYKFGLHGISTSPFMADKARREFGMACDDIGLGINSAEYHLDNTSPRKKIIFYARPVTPRRGFELGVLALQLFHKAHPEYEINFIGWDTARYEIPFPYVNNGIINTEQLNKLYNESAACLALSFTSMSLLPIELMASGCVPVVNEGAHTRMVDYADGITYAEPAPQALADGLSAIVDGTEADQIKHAQKIADYATQFTWAKYNDQLQKILLRELS